FSSRKRHTRSKRYWSSDVCSSVIVLPFYEKYTDINKPEIIEMLLEHVQIRKGMTQLLADELTIEEMQALGVMLQSHIRKEEQVIFPMIEAALPEDELKN